MTDGRFQQHQFRDRLSGFDFGGPRSESGEEAGTLGDGELHHHAYHLAALRAVAQSEARLCILAVSDGAAGENGPRRLTEVEMRAPFTDGWFLEDLRRAKMTAARC